MRAGVKRWWSSCPPTCARPFPGVSGFSTQNLWYMRQFFHEYSATPNLQPLVGEIGWAHNLLILSRCKDAQAREFYLRTTRKFGWSKNVLAHQIDNQSFEKSLLGQTNFDRTLTPAQHAQATLAVKDDYVFDFLELGARHSEHELERALIARMEDFLRAMGGMFAFMGSQYRLEVDGREFFIDLLLFHRRLRALVATELKIGEFEPEFVGKMQFYLAALDAQVRQADENPSIGIILCKEKTRTIVEYALRDARKPIGVATYQITKTLPKNLHLVQPAQAVGRQQRHAVGHAAGVGGNAVRGGIHGPQRRRHLEPEAPLPIVDGLITGRRPQQRSFPHDAALRLVQRKGGSPQPADHLRAPELQEPLHAQLRHLAAGGQRRQLCQPLGARSAVGLEGLPPLDARPQRQARRRGDRADTQQRCRATPVHAGLPRRDVSSMTYSRMPSPFCAPGVSPPRRAVSGRPVLSAAQPPRG